jgi:hypothetical protein
MKGDAVSFEEIAFARGALELAPGAAARMTIGAQVAQPQLAAIRAVNMGTKIP